MIKDTWFRQIILNYINSFKGIQSSALLQLPRLSGVNQRIKAFLAAHHPPAQMATFPLLMFTQPVVLNRPPALKDLEAI